MMFFDEGKEATKYKIQKLESADKVSWKEFLEVTVHGWLNDNILPEDLVSISIHEESHNHAKFSHRHNATIVYKDTNKTKIDLQYQEKFDQFI